MNNNKITDIFAGACFILLFICLAGLCGFIFIELKSHYIDVQLKERLLYSGDNYTQEAVIIG